MITVITENSLIDLLIQHPFEHLILYIRFSGVILIFFCLTNKLKQLDRSLQIDVAFSVACDTGD